MANIGLVMALNPVLGYEACTRIAQKAFTTGATVVDVVLEEGVLTKEQLAKLLDLESLTRPSRARL
jgi:aspartate ammonia-lyase